MLLGCLLASPAAATQQAPPDDAYRTLETERFRVTYTPGLASLAERAGVAAERALDRLSESLLPPPEGVIDVLLTDHADVSNGVAYVFPSNRITIFAQPPLQGMGLSHFDEWIELVVIHELTHTVQLDHVGALGSVVRSVFGRPPWTWPAYPGYTAAPFGVEGIAVVAETRQSSAGRLESTFFESIARTQALGGVAESASQALGDSPYWPGGARPYLFGSLFFEYLTEEYGADAVAEYFAALADQWIPYRLDAAARSAFGRSFTQLWAAWRARDAVAATDLTRRIAAEPRGHVSSDVEVITDGARDGLHAAPRPGDPSTVAYVRSDGRSDPRLVLIEDGVERTLTRWNSLDPPRWSSADELLATQLEHVDRYRIYRDLYRISIDGTVTRLTHGLRVVHADPNRLDGTIVAVLADGGTNRLVVLDDSGSELRELASSRPGVLWSYPRWSPDGARIAAARRTPDGRSAIVVMDPDGEELATLMDELSQQTAPAWGPDGRTLLWASDRTGVPNLFVAHSPETNDGGYGLAMQITDLATAGSFPAADDEGVWIHFSVLGPDGWDVARVPYQTEIWARPGPIDARFDSGVPGPRASRAPGSSDRPYSALSTLLPRYWAPVRVPGESSLGRDVLDTAWGARTSAYDLVGRHAYEASVAVSPGGGLRRWEWSGRYTWSGLGNPVLFVDASQSWETRAPLLALPDDAPPGAEPDTLLTVARERWVGGGFELRRQRARSSLSLVAAGRLIDQERRLFEVDGSETERFSLVRPEASLFELRVSAGWSTARGHAFSVSREDGVSISLALRERWDTNVPRNLVGELGGDRGLRDAVLTIQGYEGFRGPGFASHVLAVRGSVGLAEGPGAGSGHFAVGGGRGDTLGFLGGTLGSGRRQFPVRGIPPGGLRGDRAWSTSVEWRVPLAEVRWGHGAWPLYVDRLAGGLFVDFGGTERDDVEGRSIRDSAVSAGVEIAAFHSRFFEGAELIRAGLAVPIDAPAGLDRGASFYLETGWSF